MKKLYILVAAVLIIVITGCSSSGGGGTGSNDYTSAYIGTLKYVPAGTFQRDVTPANTSTVSAFRMSEYEISMEQFVDVTGLENPSTFFTGVVNGPVQMTNWYHALVFCNLLSMAEGLTPVYTISDSTDPAVWGVVPTVSNATWDAAIPDWSANGYRLPTEMEWMWAAMGATSGSGDHIGGIFTNGYRKEFAGDPNPATSVGLVGYYAWYVINAVATTHTVGQKLPNELGLYDMSGNVLEWCWDWYADYPNGLQTNYRGADPGAKRVSRGGSWYSSSFYVSVAQRYYADPYYHAGHDVGFRVVRN